MFICASRADLLVLLWRVVVLLPRIPCCRSVPWVDDAGNIQMNRGYRVQVRKTHHTHSSNMTKRLHTLGPAILPTTRPALHEGMPWRRLPAPAIGSLTQPLTRLLTRHLLLLSPAALSSLPTHHHPLRHHHRTFLHPHSSAVPLAPTRAACASTPLCRCRSSSSWALSRSSRTHSQPSPWAEARYGCVVAVV